MYLLTVCHIGVAFDLPDFDRALCKLSSRAPTTPLPRHHPTQTCAWRHCASSPTAYVNLSGSTSMVRAVEEMSIFQGSPALIHVDLLNLACFLRAS